MALPKRRHSKARTRKRRANWRIKPPVLSKCPECGSLRVNFFVCPYCGFYKNRKVVSK